MRLLCPKGGVKCEAATAVRGGTAAVDVDVDVSGNDSVGVSAGAMVGTGKGGGGGSVSPRIVDKSGKIQVIPDDSASLAVLPSDDVTNESALGREYFDPQRVFISHQRYATQDVSNCSNNNNSSNNNGDNNKYNNNNNNNNGNNNGSNRGGGSANKMVIGNEAYEQYDNSSGNAKDLKSFNMKRKEELRNKIENDRLHTITDILQCSPQCDPSLLSFLACGLAYHHAGLNMMERGSVETAFKSGGCWDLY